MKTIILNSPEGLVEVPAEGHRYAQITQGVGYGVGFGIGAAVWAGKQGVKALGNTNVGLGVQHGYAAAHLKGDTMVKRHELSKIKNLNAKATAEKAGLSTEGTEEQIVTRIAEGLVISDYKENKVHKVYHTPVMRKVEPAQPATVAVTRQVRQPDTTPGLALIAPA